MRKVLFLMFLLLLIVLGAAGVKAQVRIGGNGAPNAAAVLDLNATDATNNGTKGLALPRVNLTSNTMQITTGVANLTGMLVYNTNTILGTGIYFWSGSRWVLANLPTTVPADSGKYLMSTGSGWALSGNIGSRVNIDSGLQIHSARVVTWGIIVDTTLSLTYPGNSRLVLTVQGLSGNDLCYETDGNNGFWISSEQNSITIYNVWPFSWSGRTRFRCLRAW